MKYQSGDFEAVHNEPIWRDRSNFVFTAHLGMKDGKNQWEQLWGTQTSSHRFILCCIPFFTYGIALGDEIETDEDFVFQRVIQHGGQKTLRLWFGDQDNVIREQAISEIENMRLSMEWSSVNLLALSVPTGPKLDALIEFLRSREEQGLLQFELGTDGDNDLIDS